MHTRVKPLAADVDLAAIARQTAGLTGADLANLCNEAAILAGRHGVHEASERSTSTLRWSASSPGFRQRRVVSDKEKRILAYHEGVTRSCPICGRRSSPLRR